MKSKAMRALSFVVFSCLIASPIIAFAPDCSAEDGPKSMFDLYESNEKKGVGNYITEDFLVLAYFMVIDEGISAIEQGRLYPEFRKLVESSIQQLEPRAKDEIDAANLDFLHVLACLLDGREEPVKKTARNVRAVGDELAKILAAEETSESAMMRQTIDYSQFRPRGKYAKSREMSQYFRAMKYAGTVVFPLVASKSTGISEKDADFLTRMALGLSSLICDDPEIEDIWNRLEKNFAALFGPPDDMTVRDYWDGARGRLGHTCLSNSEGIVRVCRKKGTQTRRFIRNCEVVGTGGRADRSGRPDRPQVPAPALHARQRRFSKPGLRQGGAVPGEKAPILGLLHPGQNRQGFSLGVRTDGGRGV